MSVAQQSRLDGDTNLTDLCTICHVNPLKYTCPRCGVHTCSLPCVKRHKQWAQCSGIRDPAEYRKRSELATPSSIDKDFNFITSVERVVQRADGTVQGRGIDLTPARNHVQGAKSKLDINLAERRINIVRAPKGLSRSKQNKTRWASQFSCVLWTVEWILEGGQKKIGQVHENRTIEDSYFHSFGKRSGHLKRKRPDADDGDSHCLSRSDHEPKVEEAATMPGAQKPGVGTKGVSTTGHDKSPHAADRVALSTTIEKAGQSSRTSARTPPPTSTISNKQEHGPDVVTELDQSSKSSGSSDLNFYLHRPNTESRFKCLIPLQAGQMLQEAMNGKSFIEFPTIYVRHETPLELREPFISETEYLSRYGTDIPINININIPTAPSAAEEGDAKEAEIDVEEGEVSDSNLQAMKELDGVSSTKLLEVLAEDLGG